MQLAFLLCFCFISAALIEFDEWEDQGTFLASWGLWRIFRPRTVPLLRAELLFSCGSQEIRVLIREGLYALARLNDTVCPSEQMQAIKLSASDPSVIAQVLTSLNILLPHQTTVSLTGLPTREIWTSPAFRELYCGTGNIAVTLSAAGALGPAAEVFDARYCLEPWKAYHALAAQKANMPKWAQRAKSWFISEPVLHHAQLMTDIQASVVVLGGVECEEATVQTAIEWQAFFSHLPMLEQLWFRTPFTALDKYQMLYFVISGLIQSVHDEPHRLQTFASYDPDDTSLPRLLQHLSPSISQQCHTEQPQTSNVLPTFFDDVRDCWNWTGVAGYNRMAGSLAVDLLETFAHLSKVDFSSFEDVGPTIPAPLKCTSRILNAVLAGPIKFSPGLKLVPVECSEEPPLACQQWIRAGLCVDFLSFDMTEDYWRCTGDISFSSYQEECHRVHLSADNPRAEKIEWFNTLVAPQITSLQLADQECSNPFFPCLYDELHLHNFSSLVELEIGNLEWLTSTAQIQGLATSAHSLKRVTLSNPFLNTLATNDLPWSPLSATAMSKEIAVVDAALPTNFTPSRTAIQFPVYSSLIEINSEGSGLIAPCLYFQHFPRLRQLRLTIGNVNHSVVKCHTPYVEALLPKPIVGSENCSFDFDLTCLPPPRNDSAIPVHSQAVVRSSACTHYNMSSNVHPALKDSIFWREEPIRFMCRTKLLNLSHLLLDDVGLTSLFSRKYLVPEEGKPEPLSCVNHSLDLSHNNITTLPAYVIGSIFTQVVAASNPIMRLNFSMSKDTQTSRLLKYSPLIHLDISMCPVCYINFIPNVHFRRLKNVTLVPRPPLSTLTQFWGSKNGCPGNQSMPFGLHFWNRVQQNSSEDANLCVELSREIETSANYRITPNRGLMVLGDSCAGKTSTIAKLVDSTAGCIERADRTITMETGLLELDVSEGAVNHSLTCDERPKCVVLRYHDTGGQLRYRAYQPSFMSDENVFLILFDSTLLLTSMTSAVSQRLWHWVRHITDSTEGEPAIFVVANFMERTMWSNAGPPRKEFVDQILLGMHEIVTSLTSQPDVFSFRGLYLLDVCSSEHSHDILESRYKHLRKNFTTKVPFKFSFNDLKIDLHSYLNSVPTAVSLYYSAIAPCLRELLAKSKPWNRERVSKILPSDFYLPCGFSTNNWDKELQAEWNVRSIWPHIMDKQTFLFLINHLYMGDAADKKREAIGESVADDVIRYLHDTGEVLIPFLQNVHNRSGYRASHARIADDATVVLNSQFIARGLEEMVQDVNRGVMGFSREAFWAYFSHYVPEVLQSDLEETLLDFLAHDIAIKSRSSIFIPSTIVLSPPEYEKHQSSPIEFYMVPSLLPDFICEGCQDFGLSRLPPEYSLNFNTSDVCIHTPCVLGKLQSNSLVQANWISFLQHLLEDVGDTGLIRLEVAGYQVKFAVFDHLVDVFWVKLPPLPPPPPPSPLTASQEEGLPEQPQQTQSTTQQPPPQVHPQSKPKQQQQGDFEGLVRVLFDEQHNRVLFGDISFHPGSPNLGNASDILLFLLAAVRDTTGIEKSVEFLPFQHPKFAPSFRVNFDAREAAHALLKGTSPPTLEQLSLQRNEAFDQGCPMLEDAHARIFTLATSVQSRSPDVVVIFVHGLNGNALNTWEHYDPSRGEFFVWPRDFLPQAAQFFYATAYTRHDSISSMKPTDLLNVEVISLSYHNHVSGHKDFDCRKIGEQFSLLLSSRHLENVPLIWVGHDMGGLAIECILTHAAKEIKEQSVLSVFFGVPHQGSIVTRLSGLLFLVLFFVVVILALASLLAVVPDDRGENNWRNTFFRWDLKNIHLVGLRGFVIAVLFLAPGRLYWSIVCQPGPRFSPHTCQDDPYRDVLLLAPYGASAMLIMFLCLGLKHVVGLCLFFGSLFLSTVQFGSFLFILLLCANLNPVVPILGQACLLVVFFCWFLGLQVFENYVSLQDLLITYLVLLVVPIFRDWSKTQTHTPLQPPDDEKNASQPHAPPNTTNPQPYQFWQAIANNLVTSAWGILQFRWMFILLLYPLAGNLRHRVRDRKAAFALWLPAVYFLITCLVYVSFHSKLSLLSSPAHIRDDYLKSLNMSGLPLTHECFFFETVSDFGLDSIFPPVTKEEAVPKDKADSPWLKIFNGTAPHFEMVKYSRRAFRFPKMSPGSKRMEDAFATWRAVRFCLTDPVCKSLPPVLVARWVADAVHNFWVRKGVGSSPADECRGALDPRK